MIRQRGLAEALGDAVTDVRQKLVEEAWFGRTVTPPPMNVEPSLAEALGWATQREAGVSPMPADAMDVDPAARLHHEGHEPGLAQMLRVRHKDAYATPEPQTPSEHDWER